MTELYTFRRYDSNLARKKQKKMWDRLLVRNHRSVKGFAWRKQLLSLHYAFSCNKHLLAKA